MLMYLLALALIVTVEVNGQVQLSSNSSGGWQVVGSTLVFNCTAQYQIGRAALVANNARLIDSTFVTYENGSIGTSSNIYTSPYNSSRLKVQLMTNVKSALFILSNIMLTDGPSYSCVIYSIINTTSGSSTSNTLQLNITVLPKAPQITIVSPALGQPIAIAGYQLQITCSANVGRPYSSQSSTGLTVTVGGGQVSPMYSSPFMVTNADTTISLTNTFSISAVSVAAALDNQILACAAVNNYITSSNLASVVTQQYLVVNYPVNSITLLRNAQPILVDPIAVVTIAVVGNDVVQCQANGTPQPSYNWILLSGTAFVAESHAGAMVVPDGLVTSAVYQCNATNVVNNVATTVSLTVSFTVTQSPIWLAAQANKPAQTYSAGSSIFSCTFANVARSLSLLIITVLLRLL